MSSKSTSTVIAGPPDPKLDETVTTGFGLGQKLTSVNYEILNIQLERDTQNVLGIQLTETCIVHSVNRENVDVLFGDLWLELNGTPLENKKHFSSLYRKLGRSNDKFILNLKIARLICRHKMLDEDMKRLPIDITPSRNFKYHKALVYGVPGLHLTLGLKAINNKVYVAAVSEETLGKMSFAVGDSILDVDNHVVFTIADTYEYLKKQLKKKCVATCLVERADAEDSKYQVREALRSEKNLQKNERMSKDVEKICRKERRKILRSPEITPIKSILRISKTRSEESHIQLLETPTVVPISADIHPKLLKNVPSKNLLPMDTPLAPGKTAEAIISEISSDQLSSVKSMGSSDTTGKKKKDKKTDEKKTDEKRTKEDTTQDKDNNTGTKTKTTTGSAEDDRAKKIIKNKRNPSTSTTTTDTTTTTTTNKT